MGSCQTNSLWMWTIVGHEPHSQHVPINKIWRQIASTLVLDAQQADTIATTTLVNEWNYPSVWPMWAFQHDIHCKILQTSDSVEIFLWCTYNCWCCFMVIRCLIKLWRANELADDDRLRLTMMMMMMMMMQLSVDEDSSRSIWEMKFSAEESIWWWYDDAVECWWRQQPQYLRDEI